MSDVEQPLAESLWSVQAGLVSEMKAVGVLLATSPRISLSSLVKSTHSQLGDGYVSAWLQ